MFLFYVLLFKFQILGFRSSRFHVQCVHSTNRFRVSICWSHLCVGATIWLAWAIGRSNGLESDQLHHQNLRRMHFHFFRLNHLSSVLTSHFSLLTSHFSLLTSHFSLLTSHFSLLTSHFSLLTSHFTPHSSPLNPHCSNPDPQTLNTPSEPSLFCCN